MREHLHALVTAYSISEFLLAQHRSQLVQVNSHTRAVKERATRVASVTFELLEKCNYKPFLYANDYVGNKLVSSLLEPQPLFNRGDVYFHTVHGGGIVFALDGDLNSAHQLEANGEILNFQSGRFEDEEAFQYFLDDIKPSLDAVISHLSE